MKIMICCSTTFYDRVEEISNKLISKGYSVIYPNGYLENNFELDENVSDEEYSSFFRNMYQESIDKIKEIDAILVLNYDKNKNGDIYKNYIGASTFLEMYEAFMNNKKIFLFNEIPENMLFDEIKSFQPTIIKGNIENI